MINKTCPECKRPYNITDADEAWLLASGEIWQCPNCGYRRHYTTGSMDKARRKFVELFEQNEKLETSVKDHASVRDYWVFRERSLERSNAALRGVITKLKEKLKGGE